MPQRDLKNNIAVVHLGNLSLSGATPASSDWVDTKEYDSVVLIAVNVASPNNRIRIPSRKNLAQAAEAADAIGAAGLIVHGGHVGDAEIPATCA